MLEHGGRLRRAAEADGSRIEDWVDLSTGVGPCHWPVAGIPPACWQRLPEEDDGLLEAARAFYGVESLLAVDGSQCAIQLLPRLLRSRRVAVVSPAYAEHAHAWRQNGSEVHELDYAQADATIDCFDAVVLVNPNNPTGEYRPPADLMRWHSALQTRGGWLIIDEAFMDPTPHLSVIRETSHEGLIVLRSFGKFFGCPGARLGFVAAHAKLLEPLRELVGPWPVSGPARWVGTLALRDVAWCEGARNELDRASGRLAMLLSEHGLRPAGGTPLFQWVRTGQAQRIYEHFLKCRILPRLFFAPAGLRFGLPGAEKEWDRLRAALGELSL